MKILDFAIDVERAEQDLYLRLADCSADRSIKSIFQMIAAKEMVLVEKLRGLKCDPLHREQELSRTPKAGGVMRRRKNDFCELLDQNEVRDDLSSYDFILRTEQLVYNLYVNLKDNETDSGAQSLLDLLLNEKRQEIDRISTLYDVARVIQ